MKPHHLLAVSAAMAALLIAPAARADAQLQHAVNFGPRNNFSSHANNFSGEGMHGGFHGNRGGFGSVFIVEREVPVIVDREVVREAPAPPPTPSPEEKRKPYVIGSSYASLPGGCMKMIDDGVSYYFCGGGEWYRQSGKLYWAVARKL
jgi:hypothetical protein